MDSHEMNAVPYAGFWRRCVAWLVDYLILGLITTAVLMVLRFMLSDLFALMLLNLSPHLLFLFLFSILLVVVLYYLCEASPLQATFGKYVAGLKITTLDGARISYRRAFLRRIYSLLSILSFLLGYFVAAFTQRKQTLHDCLAKTVVIVDKNRSGLILVGIAITSITIGALLARYGMVGSFYIKTPAWQFNFQQGFQRTLSLKGNEVSAELQQAIREAIQARKVFLREMDRRGDYFQIRQFFSERAQPGTEEAVSKKMVLLSWSELRMLAKFTHKIHLLITEERLFNDRAIWMFNESNHTIKIKIPLTQQRSPFITVELISKNGKWR